MSTSSGPLASLEPSTRGRGLATAYALAVHYSEFVRAWPSIGVAIGSVPGSAANFLGARQWVFSGSRGKSPVKSGDDPKSRR